MKIYTLNFKQKLPVTKQKAWRFLSDPANLEALTPESMGFDIISGGDKKMFPGQIVQYTITPIANIKLKWVTEITQVKEQEYFVDEQRFGPYAFWHHKHFIDEIENGIEMTDIVDYKLPLGLLGRAAHPFIVKPKLDEIFSYRRQKLESLFGRYPQ